MSCVATLTLGPGDPRVRQVTVVIPESGPLANIREPCVGAELRRRGAARHAGGDRRPDDVDGAADHRSSGTQPFACRAFTIADKVQECSPGFVMNDAGRCVCPEGTTATGSAGRCKASRLRCASPPPPVEECKLLPGQIRTEDGRCVCPRGTELVNRKCVKDEPTTQCRLLPGQIRLENGRCVCPRGTSLVRGECRKDQPPQCTPARPDPGTQDGRCGCPPRHQPRRGQCRKDAAAAVQAAARPDP